MSDITQARKDLVARILEGDARASRAQRRAAFDNAGLAEPLARLIDKVAKQAYKVTDEDIAAARASGLTEDQIFELVVCAAVGQAMRQYDTVDADDMRAVLAAGVSREQIEDALAVCFSFNTVDRLSRTFGFFVPGPKAYKAGAKFLLARGYR